MKTMRSFPAAQFVALPFSARLPTGRPCMRRGGGFLLFSKVVNVKPLTRHLLTPLLAFVIPTVPLHAEMLFNRNAVIHRNAPAAPDSKKDEKSVAEAPPAAPFEPLAVFMNNDRLHGALDHAEQGTIFWRHKDSRTPLTFSAKGLRHVLLGRPAPADTSAAALVVLTNGDVLPCQSLSLDTDRIVVSTAFAGKLSINRHMLAEMRPTKAVNERIVYELGDDATGWKCDENMGRGMKDRATAAKGVIELRQGGSLAKDIGLPEMAAIDFDLAGLGMNSNLCIFFYSETIARYRGNAYAIGISPNYLSFQTFTHQGNRGESGGNTSISKLLKGKAKCHVTLLTDKKNRAFRLLVNGSQAGQWNASKDIGDSGGILGFANDSQGKFRISNLRVTKWNGEQIDAKPLPEAECDSITLGNGDKISGALTAVSEAGIVTMKTDFADFTIPLDRCVSLRTAGSTRWTPRRDADDVRVLLDGSACVTLKLSAISDNAVAGSSEAFGDTKVDLATIRRILFNIHTMPPFKEELEKEAKKKNADPNLPDDQDEEDNGEGELEIN